MVSRRLCNLLLGVALLSAIPLGGMAQGLSPHTYQALAEIHELLAEERHDAAIAALNKLQASLGDDAYEDAVVQQTLGYAYLGKNQYLKAAQAMDEALALDALPPKVEADLLYNLAQIYLTAERPREALERLEGWFTLVENASGELEPPTPQAYLLRGNVLARMGRYADAIPAVRHAIENAARPQRSWYQFLLAMHYELDQYTEAAALLERMVRLWPDEPAQWRQLGSLYVALQDDQRALATLQLAYRRGMLATEQDLLTLVRLSAYKGIPEQGARVLQQALEAGGVGQQHWRLLADLWIQAKEYARAIKALQSAIQRSPDATLYLRMAQLHFEQGEWEAAVEAARRCTQLGPSETADRAYLLLGLTYLEQQEYPAAKEALLKARASKITGRQANQWLDYLEQLSSRG